MRRKRHMVHRYLRKPVAMLAVPAITGYGVYDGMAVLCDDGAIFFSWPDGDLPRTWTEGTPIPGSVRAMNLADPDGRDPRTIPKKKKKNARRRMT